MLNIIDSGLPDPLLNSSLAKISADRAVGSKKSALEAAKVPSAAHKTWNCDAIGTWERPQKRTRARFGDSGAGRFRALMAPSGSPFAARFRRRVLSTTDRAATLRRERRGEAAKRPPRMAPLNRRRSRRRRSDRCRRSARRSGALAVAARCCAVAGIAHGQRVRAGIRERHAAARDAVRVRRSASHDLRRRTAKCTAAAGDRAGGSTDDVDERRRQRHRSVPRCAVVGPVMFDEGSCAVPRSQVTRATFDVSVASPIVAASR